MLVARIIRLCILPVAIVPIAVAAGDREEAKAPPPVTAEVSVGTMKPFAGRLCPRDAGYGRFSETITLQDI